MRDFSPIAKKLISQGTNFAFLFELILEDGREIFLTNYPKNLKVNKLIYRSNTSLCIVKANFNDCADDIVELAGCFEEKAIDILDNIKNARVKIKLFLLEHSIVEELLTMYCFSMQKENLEFKLILRNQIDYLKRNVTKFYSKSCRATLGDHECGVNLDEISELVPVYEIKSNSILISTKQSLGYYDYGKVKFSDTSSSYLIVKQNVNSLILAELVPKEFLQVKNIRIFPGCNKSIEMCCEKFRNVLNFRGEPFMPEVSYEKLF